ncbi:unnamed protein product [Bursaphelenchus okinawaensis]|uniref:PDZ domain-containing protein n=1 Tax=Bursaphelenchus okinawaensis TaxID=465554 RepID=A0A811JV09_9BILA|nr:unnamed protein product [Bursaphelenchus okinawaensis]CAG9085112.1 unnamed protein product [Bursaphelenchus okinawaensis]
MSDEEKGDPSKRKTENANDKDESSEKSPATKSPKNTDRPLGQPLTKSPQSQALGQSPLGQPLDSSPKDEPLEEKTFMDTDDDEVKDETDKTKDEGEKPKEGEAEAKAPSGDVKDFLSLAKTQRDVPEPKGGRGKRSPKGRPLSPAEKTVILEGKRSRYVDKNLTSKEEEPDDGRKSKYSPVVDTKPAKPKKDDSKREARKKKKTDEKKPKKKPREKNKETKEIKEAKKESKGVEEPKQKPKTEVNEAQLAKMTLEPTQKEKPPRDRNSDSMYSPVSKREKKPEDTTTIQSKKSQKKKKKPRKKNSNENKQKDQAKVTTTKNYLNALWTKLTSVGEVWRLTEKEKKKEENIVPATPYQLYDRDPNVQIMLDAVKLARCPMEIARKLEVTVVFPPGSPKDVRLYKTMQVINMPAGFVGDCELEETDPKHLDLGDWVCYVNGTVVRDRTEYTAVVTKLQSDFEANENKLEVKYTIVRTLRKLKIPSKSQLGPLVPLGYEFSIGFTYLAGFLTLYPLSCLGINVKAYDGKVLISSIDNGFKSLGKRTFVIGDTIMSIDGQGVGSVATAKTAISKALQEGKRFCVVGIERPQSSQALLCIKNALLQDKTIPINPRMMDDVVAICDAEKEVIKRGGIQPGKSIYTGPPAKRDPDRCVRINDESQEIPIQCDPYNAKLLVNAPPRPAGGSKKKSKH